MCILHNSHSDILPLTSHISTSVHIHLWIYTTPYSFITTILCKYTEYTIFTNTYTNTTLHTHTSIHSCVCSPIYIMHTHTESTQQTRLAYLLPVERACMRSSQPSYHIIQPHTRCIQQQSTSYEL